MNQIDLNGHVAVITGGAKGIGFAIAKRLGASGANVWQNFPLWPAFLTTLQLTLISTLLAPDAAYAFHYLRFAGSFDSNYDQQAVAAAITLSAPLLVFMLFQKYFAMDASNTSGGKE